MSNITAIYQSIILIFFSESFFGNYLKVLKKINFYPTTRSTSRTSSRWSSINKNRATQNLIFFSYIFFLLICAFQKNLCFDKMKKLHFIAEQEESPAHPPPLTWIFFLPPLTSINASFYFRGCKLKESKLKNSCICHADYYGKRWLNEKWNYTSTKEYYT